MVLGPMPGLIAETAFRACPPVLSQALFRMSQVVSDLLGTRFGVVVIDHVAVSASDDTCSAFTVVLVALSSPGRELPP